MNTKSALIIAVAIVIGFSIEPIVEKVDFSDPHHRLIKVVNTIRDEYAYELYVRAGDFRWKQYGSNEWYSDPGGYTPADEYALQAILDIKDY